jgi:HK97 gp10 family phage protein
MTTRATLDVKGMDQYLEAIQKAGIDIDAAAQRALAAGAEVLHAEMDHLVPVGNAAEGDEHPGNLRKAIVIEGPYQDGNVSYVQIGVVNADADTAIYGNVQEYGSPSKHIKPQSYIRAAVDHKAATVKRTIRESLKSEGFVNG